MKRKLIIRRVSSFVPTFLLIGLLLLAGLLGWLTFFGLPGAALRYLEEQAAAQGIYLHIGQIRLSPSAGLALRAKGIELRATRDADRPLVEIPELLASVRASKLLQGELVMARVQVKGGCVSLPVTDRENAELTLSHISANAIFRGSNDSFDAEADMQLLGIPIVLHYSCTLPATALPEDSATEDTTADETSSALPRLDAELAQIQPYINQVYNTIKKQNWEPQDTPGLNLRIQQKQDDTEAALVATVPRFEAHGFHFRDARMILQYEGQVLTISDARFTTVDPNSEVSLKAAYSLEENRVSFRLSSTAAVVPMAKSLLQEQAPILEKFHHADEHAPKIAITGDLQFTDDNGLEHAQIQGTIDQEQLQIGSRTVDELGISFSYNDGNFNIDKFGLEYGGGFLSVTAQAQEGSGDIAVRCKLPVEETLALVSEFTESPVSLPQPIKTGDTIELQMNAKLNVAYRKGDLLTLRTAVPTLQNCHLTLRSDSFSYNREINLSNPEFRLTIRGLEHNAYHIPYKADIFRLRASFDSAGIETEGAAPALSLSRTILSTSAKDVQIDPTTWKTESISAEAATLFAACRSFAYGDISGENLSAAGVNLGSLLRLNKKDHFTITSNVSAQVQHLRYKDTPGYNASLLIIPTSLTHGMLKIDIRPDGQESGASPLASGKAPTQASSVTSAPAHNSVAQDTTTTAPAAPKQNGSVSFSYSLSPDNTLSLQQISALVPVADYAPILASCGVTIQEIDLPPLVSLEGSARLNLDNTTLESAQVSVDIPSLTRISCAVPALAGTREEIALSVNAHLAGNPDNGTLTFEGDLQVAHQTGKLTGTFTGDTTGKLSIKANSDISLKALDHLIDVSDAHSIIRDFDVSDASQTHITNIDVDLDLSQGLKLRSDCDVELRNMGYQLDAVRDETDEQGNPTGKEIKHLDMVRVDKVSCHVTTIVNYDQVNTQGLPLPDEATVSINNPELIYDNRDWIQRHKFTKASPQTTSLKGDRILLDLEKNTVELFKLRGNVYPAYSIGMFYSDLYGFLEDARITYPVTVETDYCRFPIASNCQESMTGLISCKSSTKIDYTFAGIVFPLEDFSGFVDISDDFVTLDRLNAQCWSGVINAIIKFGISTKRTSIDGYLRAANMDLRQIARAMDSDQSHALCNGEIRFQAPGPDIKDLQAYGYISASSGDLMNLEIFHPVGEFISDLPNYLGILSKKADTAKRSNLAAETTDFIMGRAGRAVDRIGNTASSLPFANHLIKYSLSDASTKFDMIGGHFITREAQARGVNLSVKMKLDINMMDMTLSGDLWPSIDSVPAVVLKPITFLSDFMIDIRLHGPLHDISWSIGLDDKTFSNTSSKKTPATAPVPTTKRQKKKRQAR